MRILINCKTYACNWPNKEIYIFTKKFILFKDVENRSTHIRREFINYGNWRDVEHKRNLQNINKCNNCKWSLRFMIGKCGTDLNETLYKMS